MPNLIHVQYVTIPLSGFVSGTVNVKGDRLHGLWVPVVTSAVLYVLGSFDTTSANFVRLQKPDGSADWTLAAGTGSKAVTLQDFGFTWPYLRLESSVAQAAVRSFAVVSKV